MILITLLVLITTAVNAVSPHNYEELQPEDGKILELLHIVFRHGARTPRSTYPNDPYSNHTYEPYGWGELTNDAKRKLYDTGEWLRARYNKFLGTTYFPELVYAQATKVTRTIISLQTVLAGLFPPKGTPLEWNKNLNWQPIPVLSQPLDEEALLFNCLNCPRCMEAEGEVMRRPEVTRKLKESENILKELAEMSGLKIKSNLRVLLLYSIFQAQEAYGLNLPEWVREYYPEKMQELANISYIWSTYTHELKQIGGGPFITKMSNEWKERRDSNLSNPKLFIYSGHDATVVNILAALEIWKIQFPDYLIMAIFELYKDTITNKYELKIYQKNEGEDLIPLVLPGCMEICPLEKVLEIIEPVIITSNRTEYCTRKDPNFTAPIPSESDLNRFQYTLFVLFLVTVSVFMWILCGLFACRYSIVNKTPISLLI